MHRGHMTRAGVLVAAVLTTSSCALLAPRLMSGVGGGPDGGTSCSSWGTTMSSDQHGEKTPLAAVLKAAAEQHEPTEGWIQTGADAPAAGSDTGGQTFSFGPMTIHVQPQPDGTWFADNGSSCGGRSGSAYSSRLQLSFSASPSPAP